jgi:hypothetical protein
MNQTVDRRESKIGALVVDVVLLGLPFLGLLPMLAVQTRQTLSQNFSLGFPVVWLALLMLVIWTRRETTALRSRYWLSLVCLALSVLLGLAATGLFNVFFARISFGFCFLAWAFVRLGSQSIWRAMGMSLLIFGSMRIPSQINAILDSWKNYFVIKIASPMLDLFRHFHLYEAPDLKLQNHTFDLGELLNTPMSVQLMVLVSIIVSLIASRSFLTGLMTAISAAFWTMIAYFLFIMISAILSQNGIDVMQSSYHYGLAIGGLSVGTLILILVSDAFWNAVLQPIGVGGESAVFRSVAANIFNSMAGWPMANETLDEIPEVDRKPLRFFNPLATVVGLGLAFLAVPTGLAVLRNNLLFDQNELSRIPLDRRPDGNSFPQDFLVGQSLRTFRNGNIGKLPTESGGSALWVFTGAGVETRMTMVFPVPGWFDAKVFGLSTGMWGRSKFSMQKDSGDWPFSESVFGSENGNSAILWSSQIRTSGEAYSPTEEEFSLAMSGEAAPKSNVTFRIFDMISGPQEEKTNQSVIFSMAYQVQGEIKESDKQRHLSKYLEARQLVRQKMFGGNSSAANSQTTTP